MCLIAIKQVAYAASADDQHHDTSTVLDSIAARCILQPDVMKQSSADGCQQIVFMVVETDNHRIAHVLFAYTTASQGCYVK
jgi:hypothetical protein